MISACRWLLSLLAILRDLHGSWHLHRRYMGVLHFGAFVTYHLRKGGVSLGFRLHITHIEAHIAQISALSEAVTEAMVTVLQAGTATGTALNLCGRVHKPDGTFVHFGGPS